MWVEFTWCHIKHSCGKTRVQEMINVCLASASHTHTHAHPHTHTHTHIYIHTHTHTYIHTYTHTHTHTEVPFSFKSYSPKVEDVLPVLTKSEVQNCPLPELPESMPATQDGDDYVHIAGLHDEDYASPEPHQNDDWVVHDAKLFWVACVSLVVTAQDLEGCGSWFKSR